MQDYDTRTHQTLGTAQKTTSELERQMDHLQQRYTQQEHTLARRDQLIQIWAIQYAIPYRKTWLRRVFDRWHQKTVRAGSCVSSKFVFSNYVARRHARRTLMRRALRGWVTDVMQWSWKKRFGTEFEVWLIVIILCSSFYYWKYW